jgi:hypothetical protein
MFELIEFFLLIAFLLSGGFNLIVIIRLIKQASESKPEELLFLSKALAEENPILRGADIVSIGILNAWREFKAAKLEKSK